MTSDPRSAFTTYVLLFGIPHLLLVELDDDGAKLKNIPQQRILRQLDIDSGPERLQERENDVRNHYVCVFGAQEQEEGDKHRVENAQVRPHSSKESPR